MNPKTNHLLLAAPIPAIDAELYYLLLVYQCGQQILSMDSGQWMKLVRKLPYIVAANLSHGRRAKNCSICIQSGFFAHARPAKGLCQTSARSKVSQLWQGCWRGVPCVWHIAFVLLFCFFYLCLYHKEGFYYKNIKKYTFYKKGPTCEELKKAPARNAPERST